MTLFGIDTRVRDLAEADHLIHELSARLRLPGNAVACTHLVREGGPHIAVSLWVPPGFEGLWNELTRLSESGSAGVASGTARCGHPDLAETASDAAVEHLSRKGGRAVTYPGAAELTGTVPFRYVLERTAIERIVVVGGADEPGEDDLLETRDHVRPEWRDGELALAVTPVAGGRFAPFEVPDPTPCRAGHR
ncbi:hypothetical protein FPZ12_040660 [Amycolatopsis acidicola]|uniref:Uncharacterized protein n=1 Tax=Amycolatopsis acidicola TaxID=2596893 RepID=A0A5N0US88_9PSEU|nr:hypothetical protein [Amycolatopsis acidicola]KAA9150737.1 hypothetical protein FPZ12_040660 [Amycolatopsis acidicola]